jgi:hypothetical protein
MMSWRSQSLAAVALAFFLSGCSTLNGLIGEVDNTVLPGSREEAIPGRPTFPEKQDVAVGPTPAAPKSTVSDPAPISATPEGEAATPAEAYCAPDDPTCKPPQTTSETFQDPQ